MKKNVIWGKLLSVLIFGALFLFSQPQKVYAADIATGTGRRIDGTGCLYITGSVKNPGKVVTSNGSAINNGAYLFCDRKAEPETVLVTFVVHDGTEPVLPVSLTKGDTLPPPVVLQNVKGWYIDTECTIPYDFESPVNADLTLYAIEICLHTETEQHDFRYATCMQEGFEEEVVCMLCGTILKEAHETPKLPHTESDYLFNDKEHYTQCTVPECRAIVKEKEAHKDDNLDGKCDVCGYNMKKRCAHEATYHDRELAALCNRDGFSGDIVCADCGAIVSEGTVIPATGHNFVGIECLWCGFRAEDIIQVVFNPEAEGLHVETQEIVYNEKAVCPEDPVREGYRFEGWFTDSEGTALFDFNTELTQNTMLYAKWTSAANPSDNEKANVGNTSADVTTSNVSKATVISEKNNSLWWLWIVGGAILLTGGVLAFILLRKKKENNEK